jgi:hypothetical protein
MSTSAAADLSLVPATITTPKRDRSVPKTSPKRISKTVPAAKKTAVTMSYAQFEKLTVIAQIRRAFMPGARLSAVMGLILGGFVPVAVFSLVHFEVAKYPAMWVAVVAGLAYSAPTVFKWAKAAFGEPVKAGGFVVLLESILTFSHLHALNITALFILIFINAVATACGLQVRKEVE